MPKGKPKQKATKEKAKMGRPTDYTQELADEICERIANGESLRQICFEESKPSMVTIFRWLKDKDDFCNNYIRSREIQGDAIYEDIVRLEKAVEDKKIPFQDARVIIDSMKWRAAKMLPKKYGDKLDLGHSGAMTIEVVRFGENKNTK